MKLIMKNLRRIVLFCVLIVPLAACNTTMHAAQTLADGSTFETATNRPGVEEEVTIARVYDPSGRLLAQQVQFDDTVSGDVLRTLVPAATTAAINGVAAVRTAEAGACSGSNCGGSGVAINVQGSTAVSAANANTNTATNVAVGPCGRPTCPALGH